MTQRITIGGEEYDITGDPIPVRQPTSKVCIVEITKVEKPAHAYHQWCDCSYCSAIRQAKPAPKESERLWKTYTSMSHSQRMGMVESQCFADYILARVKEELLK